MHLSNPEIGFQEPPRPETPRNIIQTLGAGMVRIATDIPEQPLDRNASTEYQEKVKLEVISGLSGLSAAEREQAEAEKQAAFDQLDQWISKRIASCVKYDAGLAEEYRKKRGVPQVENPFDFPAVAAEKRTFPEAEIHPRRHPNDNRRRRLNPKEVMDKIFEDRHTAAVAIMLGLPMRAKREAIVETLSERLAGYSEIQVRDTYKDLGIEKFFQPRSEQ